MNPRNTSTLLTTLFLAAGSSTLASAQADAKLPTVHELIAKAQARRGDADKLAALENVKVTGTVRMAGMDDVGAFEEVFAADGAALLTSTLPSFGEFKQGSNGTVFWESNPMLGARIRENEEATIYKRMYHQANVAAWDKLFSGGECTGVEEIDGRQHYKLVLQSGCSTPDTWWIDKDSFLVTRIAMDVPSAMGGNVTMRMTFSDWKEVDGLLYPFKKQTSMGPATFEQTCQSIELDAELPAELFALPAEIETLLAARADGRSSAPPFALQELEVQHVASIRFQCKPSELSRHLAVALPEVMMHLNATGTKSAGPPFSRYYAFADTMDVEAGIPVAAKIEGKGRIKSSTLPAGTVATGWHVGPYHTISDSHAKLMEWAATQPVVQAQNGMWEVYWTDPGMEPDQNKWRTQIFLPVERK